MNIRKQIIKLIIKDVAHIFENVCPTTAQVDSVSKTYLTFFNHYIEYWMRFVLSCILFKFMHIMFYIYYFMFHIFTVAFYYINR